MTGLPWFRFRAADFIGGTAGMTMYERGAYITLLCHQWMHGPLPANAEDLKRICGGVTVPERVTAKFRNVEGTATLLNDRLEEDRSHALKVRTGGRIRKKKHDSKRKKSNALPERYDTVTEPFSSISLLPEGNRNILEAGKAKNKEADFDVFWKAYPRKIKKEDARKAWRTSKTKPPLGVILAAIESAKDSDQWRKDGGVFIPYPATWIRGGGWDDVHTIETKPRTADDDNAQF